MNKIIITGCQDEGGNNICPFCNYIKTWGGTELKCKLGANLYYSSCVILHKPPTDCPLRKNDYLYTINSN
jgi:hypothetical protein